MGETSTNIATLNMKQAIKINVKEGCEVDNPCDSNPCPQNSYCSDDWDSYSCVCDPGNPVTIPCTHPEAGSHLHVLIEEEQWQQQEQHACKVLIFQFFLFQSVLLFSVLP